MIRIPTVLFALSLAFVPNVLAAPYCPQPKICQIMSELGSIDSNSKLGKMINNSGHTLEDFLQLFCSFDTSDETITSAVSAPTTTSPSDGNNNLVAAPSATEVATTTSAVEQPEQPAQTSSPTSGNDEGDDEEDCEEEEEGGEEAADDDEEECDEDEEYEGDDEGEGDADEGEGEGEGNQEPVNDEEGADEGEEDCEEEGEETTTTSAETTSATEAPTDVPTETTTSTATETTTTSTSTEETNETATTTTQAEEADATPEPQNAGAAADGEETTTTTDAAEPSATAESPSEDEAKEFLEAHNKIRSNYGSPELVWDEELAATAAAWAANCQMEHSQAGQNLAGKSGEFSPTDAVNSWAGDEEAKFNAGNYEGAGHFTQLLWTGTKKVGCGKAACDAGTILEAKYGPSTMVVCNYDPAGNVEGHYEENLPQTN